MTADPGEISKWIKWLKEGDEEAAQRIWNEYFPRLVESARNILQRRPRLGCDEEDVALSALKSFFLRVKTFPKLDDRDDLWKLLLTITLRKAFREGRKSDKYSDADVTEWLQQLPSREPTPGDAALAIDQLDQLLATLPDDKARQVVISRLEGASISEIADTLDCSTSTVERKLRLARDLWTRM